MMIWIVPLLFALCAALLGYVVMSTLREVEEGYASEYTTDTARQFEDLFLFIPPKKMLQLSRLGAIILFFLLFIVAGNLGSLFGIIQGLIAGSLGAGVARFIPTVLLRILKVRRLERFNTQLVNALTSMSNSLRAGFSINQAFDSVVKEGANPIAQEFGMFLQQLRVGVTFEEGLAELNERVGSEDLSLMVQAVEIARQTGGNLTEVFDRIAVTIHERRRVEGKIKSLTAQGKIQGNVVGAMPFVLGFALYILDPSMMKVFISSPVGIVVMLTVVLMEICGMLMIRKIVAIDV